MATADESAAEKIGRAIDGQIYRLEAERELLVRAEARITVIDAELAVLRNEKTRIDQRRPPRTDRESDTRPPVTDQPNPREPRA